MFFIPSFHPFFVQFTKSFPAIWQTFQAQKKNRTDLFLTWYGSRLPEYSGFVVLRHSSFYSDVSIIKKCQNMTGRLGTVYLTLCLQNLQRVQ